MVSVNLDQIGLRVANLSVQTSFDHCVVAEAASVVSTESTLAPCFRSVAEAACVDSTESTLAPCFRSVAEAACFDSDAEQKSTLLALLVLVLVLVLLRVLVLRVLPGAGRG